MKTTPDTSSALITATEAVTGPPLFPVNPKTGRAWQAARYFNAADVRKTGTVEV